MIIWKVLPQETSGTLVAGEGGWTLSERPCSPALQIFCGHLGELWFVLRTGSLVQTEHSPGDMKKPQKMYHSKIKDIKMSFNMDGGKMGWS